MRRSVAVGLLFLGLILTAYDAYSQRQESGRSTSPSPAGVFEGTTPIPPERPKG